ncbi:LysR family transcriptional regulator [Streptomyces sp. DSM 44917]|uniref:LysR family transcriptional regulator n=1 Tax=Streptomyces boetiae TaxID=3075541 RepID=A0ABU2L549_9ACTN|nr:LysR family transcriptional regulator [Streptomyces sp. DSM 44917]MDT0306502.1 LysR family transcriptional regulator [Streptomyces sp. DSM 44917]
MDVELRELRYFVAVAEELNFSRAAERIGMAQPPLSRAISKLEHRLGVRLLDRDTRRVSLTPAGETLLGAANGLLESMAAAVRDTRRAAQPAPAFTVTAKPGVANGLLRRIVNAFAALPGSPPVDILVSPYRRQAELVRDGRADLALLNSPFDARGLETELLLSEERVAALSAEHPLAGRASLSRADLAGEPIARWPESTPAERLYWAGGSDDPFRADDAFRAADVEVLGPEVSDSAELLDVIGLGQAVAVVPAHTARQYPRPDIRYVPVPDAAPTITAIGWRAGRRDPVLGAFLRAARLVAAEPAEPVASGGPASSAEPAEAVLG